MKQTLTMILSVALAIVLTAGAVCLGAVRGWQSERETAAATLADAGSLAADLAARAMDAANLAVVAARHLPADDPALSTLTQTRQTLQSSQSTVQEIIAADAALTLAATELAQRLPGLPSVKASQRDQAYVSALTRTLSADTGASELYTDQVARFNQRMSASLTGKLAMLLGVEPLAQ